MSKAERKDDQTGDTGFLDRFSKLYEAVGYSAEEAHRLANEFMIAVYAETYNSLSPDKVEIEDKPLSYYKDKYNSLFKNFDEDTVFSTYINSL